jgi:hypothetical protein
MTIPTLISTPADLRPGDIMLGPIGGAVGLGVKLGQLWLGERFRVGRVSIDHAAIVTGVDTDGVRSPVVHMVEAMPTGARQVSVIAPERWTDRHAYVRLPEDYPGQAKDAATIARLMVQEEVPYSFASYAALGAWRWGLKVDRLERWINRRRPEIRYFGADGLGKGVQLPCEAICSVLVEQCWTLAGKKVMEDVRPQAVTPGALAGQLLSRPGVVWSLPRFSPQLPARSWEV